jgi:integrase
MVVSLHTRDVHVARARRWGALKAFQAAIDTAGRTAKEPPEIAVGLAYREHLLAANDALPVRMHAEASDADELYNGPTERDLTADALHDALSDLESQWGYERARAAADIAYGRATPLPALVETWLAEGGSRGPVKARTARQYRSDTAELTAWLRSASLSPTIEAVTRKIAGRYVTEALSKEASRKTANRKISAVSAYWRWLIKRGHAEANPWAGQSLAKVSVGSRESGKRPFTEAELRALLAGKPDPELADAMRIAALSGCRIEELYRLTVADCAGAWFDIRDAKTRAGIRRVPIHPDLAAIIRRRTEGRPASDYLFPEPGAPRVGYERSMAVSKRFGNYRQRVGVHDRAEGQRQSRIDFHSFRRWFVTEARNAGNDRALVAAIVGHEVGNLTDDTYSGGPSDALKVTCVASVRLP